MDSQRSANFLLVYTLCLAFTLLCASASSFVGDSQSRARQRMKRLKKPAIRIIESPDGDLIDCILISKQPALDHPLLKNHEIQMQPEHDHRYAEDNATDNYMIAEDKEVRTGRADQKILGRRPSDGKQGYGEGQAEEKPQLWHRAGISCPTGTIPIRRTSEPDIFRNQSKINNYGRKFHPPPQPSAVSAVSIGASGHQHAIGYVQGGTYYGAKANINVWNPSIQVPNEFSLSQIWILGGSFNNDLNSIEAGWQVSPDLYGDNNTRLFIYWTSDSYQTTGCYNLLCSGFVQVSNDIALGASIAPISSYGSNQYDVTFLIWKDPKQGNWWMQFGNKYIVGYWPAALFTSLSTSATMIEWGGEVVNSEPAGKHTSTQMGSGHFPFESFGRCSYFSHLLIVDSSNNLKSPGDVSTFAERPACYNVQTGASSDWGDYFYYGGPGRNPDCP